MFRSSVVLGALLSWILVAAGEAFQPLNAASSLGRTSTQLQIFGFLNEGKKALVKSLAGEYDQAAIQSRMNGLIETNPVFMFSFTT